MNFYQNDQASLASFTSTSTETLILVFRISAGESEGEVQLLAAVIQDPVQDSAVPRVGRGACAVDPARQVPGDAGPAAAARGPAAAARARRAVAAAAPLQPPQERAQHPPLRQHEPRARCLQEEAQLPGGGSSPGPGANKLFQHF